MSLEKVKVTLMSEDAKMPTKGTEGATGFDLYLSEDVVVPNINICGRATIAHTGVAIECPKGYHGEVYLRSSTGAKSPVRLSNHVGILDDDYRGEIMLLLENNSRQVVHLEKGQRIAQLIIKKTEDVELVSSKTLSKTKRGTKGLGSTGKK